MNIATGIPVSRQSSAVGDGSGFIFQDNFSFLYDPSSLQFLDFGNALDATIIGGAAKFTVSGWIKRGSIGTIQIIMGKGTDGSPQFNIYFAANNRLRMDVFDGNSANLDRYQTVSTFTDTASWHYFAIVVDMTQAPGSQVLIYFDGAVEATTLGGSGIFNDIKTSTGQLLVGARAITSGSFTQYWDGNTDQFRFYDTNLTAGNITTDYSVGTPADPRLTGFSGNLKSWWSFGDGDSFSGGNWSVIDRADGNDGVSVNMVLGSRVMDTP